MYLSLYLCVSISPSLSLSYSLNLSSHSLSLCLYLSLSLCLFLICAMAKQMSVFFAGTASNVIENCQKVEKCLMHCKCVPTDTDTDADGMIATEDDYCQTSIEAISQ